MNSMIYEVEFPDGKVKGYAVNIIAENMLSQVDLDGFSKTIFDSVIDYKKTDSAVDKADRCLLTKRGRRRLRQTRIGWKPGTMTVKHGCH